MAIATASNLGIHLGGQPIFSGVSFKLDHRDRMTLSGRNGAGKSTLLRILAGEASPDSGSLSVRRGARIALHDQRPPRDEGTSVADYVISARSDMLAIEAELAGLERRMAKGASDDDTLTAYAAAQGRLEAAGGYRWRDEVASVIHGLGFTDEQAARPLSTFSGGELTRASLARVLSTSADLLLLDEPTNHLDIPSLEWLERHLTGLDAGIVLVAHDRWFLEAVGTSVLELEAGRARYFHGPWHAWRTEQAAREIALGKAIEKQEREIARMERFVERFRYKATKARQAQSRVKMIEKVKASSVSRDPRDERKLAFSFEPPQRAGREVLKMRDARITVGDRTLLDGSSMHLERGEHAVLVGPNGSGKTTLIDTLVGRREPAAGTVGTGHNVILGYLSQHADTAAGAGSVLEAAQRETGLSGPKARDLLGGFLFSGEEVEKKLSDISGGEQRRLSLAILVSSGANVLVLDEPTNHLDIESREALEDALLAYEGAVLLVSHDRALLEAVGTRTLYIEDADLREYPGGWASFQRDRDERDTDAAVPSGNGATGTPAKKPKQRQPGPSKNEQFRLKRLEAEISRAEKELREIEDELADPAAWSSPGRSQRAGKRHEEAKRHVDELYARWEQSAGEA